jgi:hypothetical protein
MQVYIIELVEYGTQTTAARRFTHFVELHGRVGVDACIKYSSVEHTTWMYLVATLSVAASLFMMLLAFFLKTCQIAL